MKNCPYCAEQIPDASFVCPHCKKSVQGSGDSPARTSPPASIGFILRKIMWVGAIGLFVLSTGESYFSFEMQTGAPQQAASAAHGCFRLIAIYVIARGVDELTRGMRGV